MSKIKILFEGLSSNIGGIETYIHNMYLKIDKEKYDVSFMTTKDTKIAYYNEYKSDKYKFYEITDRKKNCFKYISDLKKLYKENNFDIIYINVMSYSLFERITLAYKYSNAKVIVHSHSSGYKVGYYKTRFLHQFGNLLVSKNKIYKVVCGYEARRYMFKNSEFTIFNNEINFGKFKYSNENRLYIRKELKISNNVTVFGLVAAFLPVKNHSFLIEVFNEYHNLDENSKLFLVGEGKIEYKIKEKVDAYNLSSSVLFLGKKEDVNKIYSALDIYNAVI